MQKRLITTAMAGALALNLAACGGGDSIGPQIQLTDAQIEDMMDALEGIGSFEGGFSVASAALRTGDVALYTMTLDESSPCPAGGTIRIQGTVTGADDGTSFSANITESLTSCAARSTSNTLWTFNGAPNLQIAMTGTFNNSTFAHSSNGSVTGAFNASSTMGSGNCAINLTVNSQGNSTSESGSVTGTVCGKAFSDTWTDTY